ncbi:MAG: potassium-transporting ATPase subunit KdpC, partial [Gemmatimonadales bacterium]
SIVTGVAYPAVVTLATRLIFPGRATGSIVLRDHRAVGSRLIGQSFTDPGHFWGRPSATTPTPYDAEASAGSDLALSNPVDADSIAARAARLRAADPGNAAPIPADLLTASASGLDPDISPEGASYQVPRIVRVRALTDSVVRMLVARATTGRALGLFGEPRVNVLLLNLALDSTAAARRTR